MLLELRVYMRIRVVETTRSAPKALMELEVSASQ